MPHGKPDWGIDWSPRTVRGLEDLGEHAVRLGSPHMWDRRGDVILMDTFEHGLAQCEKDGSGVDWDIALEGGYAWWGAFCAKLTTGNLAGDDALIEYEHGLPVDSRLGLEFTFSPHANARNIEWIIIRNEAGLAYEARVYYRHQAGELWCRPAPAPDVRFATGIALRDDVWQTGKIVADFAATPRAYVRFILNHREWDLTAYPLFQLPGFPERFAYWQIRHTTNVNANISAYIDNVIITQNEP